ncbi:hypothetical protein [Ornithinibacillus halophilus]|uniref:Uncharacterized protein n=1 Tax=Ornithinibacillus halophilus TaxID=930117 RepID=A0A1M5HEZ0_9BACI|nr:hypothetical protein [Ornithinibacillus halophilus]SHG14448.1 hypothetical protein SAMN05216225_101730 [Ornithinibacillus halophilus]
MSHEFAGFNKASEQIGYARFSMGNYNAVILYDLLDANEYNAGVSGRGDSTTFSVQQIEKALNSYKQLYGKYDAPSEDNLKDWDKKQIATFLQSCLATASNEGSVRVVFA